MRRQPSERAVIFLIGAVQFVNILDFVMVMPLGPMFARALAIPTSRIGLIGGAYTAAASIAGVIGSFFLDRFDRRKALAVAMLGLVTGTLMGGFATGLGSMLFARVIAGCFGGPATSLAFSVIADVVPPERRGKAMGAVAGAFSVAQVLGVPGALWLGETFGWRAPFWVVAGLGLGVSLGAVFLLPSMRGHIAAALARLHQGQLRALGALLRQGDVRLSYLMTATAMMGGFVLIPNIPAYLLQNLQYPSAGLKWLYAAGGLTSLFVLRLGGALVDRYGSFRIGALSSTLVCTVLYLGFADYRPWLPVMALFVLFMSGMSLRNVSYNTLTSKVPAPHERARFMSLQSAVQHAASAAGAMASSALLTESADGRLLGMSRVAWSSMLLTCCLPFLMAGVERRIHRRPALAPAPGP